MTIPLNVLKHAVGQFPIDELLPFAANPGDRAELWAWSLQHLNNGSVATATATLPRRRSEVC